MNGCPCEDCVCVPVCRCKLYGNLLSDCELISKYSWPDCNHSLSQLHENFRHRIVIRNTIKPTEWEVDSDGIFVDTKFPPISM